MADHFGHASVFLGGFVAAVVGTAMAWRLGKDSGAQRASTPAGG